MIACLDHFFAVNCFMVSQGCNHKKNIYDAMSMVKFSSLWLKELGNDTRTNILD